MRRRDHSRGDEQLVKAVKRHVAEAHDSFELDEVILDAAEDIPEEEEAPARSPAGAQGRRRGPTGLPKAPIDATTPDVTPHGRGALARLLRVRRFVPPQRRAPGLVA